MVNRARLMDFASAKEYGNAQKDTFNGDKVSGTIYVDNVRAANIPIWVKGKKEVSYTNANGEFTLSATLNDSILINKPNGPTFAVKDMHDKELFLKSEVTQLDEVVLIESRLQPKQKTTHSKANQEGIGYAVQRIGDDKITSINTDLNSAVNGRFSGIVTGIGNLDDKDLSKFIVRGQSSALLNNYGLIVVDGVP